MRYVSLNKKERETLEDGYRYHPKHHFRQRCQAMLLSDEGVAVPKIAKMFKVRTRTVYSWMNRWADAGLVGLMILPGRGLKPRLKSGDQDLVALVKKKQRNMPVH